MDRELAQHERVVDALAEVLTLPIQTEAAALVAMLRRTDTPHNVVETVDGATILVKVADVALFVFDANNGRCGRVLTDR